MDHIIELLKGLSVTDLLEIAGVIVLYHYFLIKPNFASIEKRFDSTDKRFDSTDRRFDRLEGELKEIRTSLNRLEGAIMSKDCVLKSNNPMEKAQ